MKTIIILLIVLAVIAVAAWKLWKSIHRRPSTVSATTSMAGKKDLATVKRGDRHTAEADFVLGRLVDDGKVTRDFVTADGTGGIVVGPTGSGKTQGIVIPTIVRHKGPLLATSTKSELADLTMSARSRIGSVAVIDPAGVVDGPAAAYVRLWTPLQACKTFNEAALTTALLVEAGGSDSGRTGSSVWTTAAKSLLTTVLWMMRQYDGTALSDVQVMLTALMSEGSEELDAEVPPVPTDFGHLVTWIATHPLGGWDAGIAVCEALAENGKAAILDAQRAAGGLRAVQQISGASETVAGVVFGVQGALLSLVGSEIVWYARWDDPGLIDLAAWASEPAGTIYVVAPDQSDPFRGLFCAFVTAAMSALDQEAWSHQDKRLPNPALFMLDELANVCPLPQLPRWLATKRSQGVKFVLGLQGLGQLWGLWSDSDAEAIINNADAFIVVLSGTQDDKTTDRVEKYSGEYLDRIETVSRSKSRGTSRSMGMSKGDSRSETDSTNWNTSASYRSLVKPAGLFQMAYGRAAVLMPRKKFALVEMVPAHADKELQVLMLPAPPPPAPPVYRPTAPRSRKLGEDATADFFTAS
ncbi:hypothetical protein nbrc107696_32820 [Gordonia spumicola]|uniref:TraD/TraG TraM recognition site domain-containing protein n=1 Tax=Gordonia spumicola TaxID=589161 RepID=A0A7I9VBU0_9ACTN|nr:type IV secretory system conjugative DNA transfer family protein [Gordonia spumicola]GEE02836.1 hypothetical protein nbrc107696_32820 [Gordonia spumicola]